MPTDPGAASELADELSRLRYGEGMGMAEALRDAQLKVMRDVGGNPAGPKPARGGTGTGHEAFHGTDPASGRAGRDRDNGNGKENERDNENEKCPDGTSAPLWEGKGFSHPSYWAPFVITGSWQ
jgi:CHAT domain-containing protein